MTVPDQTPQNVHTANGVSTTFAYQFKILDTDHLEVYLDDVLQTSGYTVTGEGVNAGGTVVFTTAPAADTEVILMRSMTIERTAYDYQNAGDFLAATVNEDFDAAIMIAQQINSKLDQRALLFPKTLDRTNNTNALPEPEEGAVLYWDENGEIQSGQLNSLANDVTFASELVTYDTMAQAIADPDLTVTKKLLVKGRANSTWDLSSSGTANTYNVVYLTASELYATLRTAGSPVNPVAFGLSTANTGAQNSAILQASLDYFTAVSNKVNDAEWEMPAAIYYVNGAVSFPSNAAYEAHRCNIIFNGWLINEDNTKDVLIFDNLYNCNIKTPVIYAATDSYTGWADDKSLVKFNGDVESCNVEIDYLYGGAKYGVLFHPDGLTHSQFTDYHIKKIYGPKHKLYFDGNTGSALSYFSGCSIYGGSYQNPYQVSSNGQGSESLHFTKKVTSLNIYGPRFAYDDTIVNFTTTTGVNVYGPYYDSQYPGTIAGDFTAAANLVWVHGAGTAFEDLNFTVTSQTRDYIFMNTGKSTSAEPVMIMGGDGYALAAAAAANLDYKSQTTYSTTYHACLELNPYGEYQYQNKQFQTAAAPTTGTYRAGAWSWNQTPASGQPIGWGCKTEGTMGTLNGGATTGSITIGTPTLVVNSATGLKYGQLVAVAGAITSATVIGISGTTITLSGNASATVAGAAVSFVAATWQAGPNYP